MPVYLLHGFRWPRAGNYGIRVHSIMHNLEDCSVEYIQNTHSTEALLGSFRKLFPDIMKELEGPGKGLRFLEQYDPLDETGENAVSQPFAFVGDKVVTIAGGPNMAAAVLDRPGSGGSKSSATPAKTPSAVATADGSALSVNVDEVVAQGPGLTSQAWEALAELRDKLAEKEKIGWWVVYNGDPERAFDDSDDEEEHDDETPTEGSEQVLTNFPAVTPSMTAMNPSDEREVSSPAFSKNHLSQATNTDPSQLITAPARDTTSKSDTWSMPSNAGNIEGQGPQPAQDLPKAKSASRTGELKKKLFGKRS